MAWRKRAQRGRSCSPTGARIDAHAVILATGVSYRQLTAPGIPELTGRGVYYGSAMSEATNCAGQDVFIVGGANSAGQAAVYFSRRRPLGDHPGSGALVRGVDVLLPGPADRRPSTTSRFGPAPRSSRRTGDEHLEHLTLRNSADGTTQAVDAQILFIFIGAAPHTQWLHGVVIRDDHGFVISGPDLPLDGQPRPAGPSTGLRTTSRRASPGVFVAGDARFESAKRVASAVGEGAMAVMLVHRYLETLTGAHAPTPPCDPEELRTLFLFEHLETTNWPGCAENVGSRSSKTGLRLRGKATRPTCFYVLMEGSVALSRRVGEDDVEVVRSDRAWRLRRRVPGLPG